MWSDIPNSWTPTKTWPLSFQTFSTMRQKHSCYSREILFIVPRHYYRSSGKN
ncbi:hypothetical protein U0070_013773 [Myodes glareolus]|uniref:Uncharacterized protein n=1 Tax=Myodes glareolus TaxID=447135 RepID=A0AAW0H8S6_MYOGA